MQNAFQSDVGLGNGIIGGAGNNIAVKVYLTGLKPFAMSYSALIFWPHISGNFKPSLSLTKEVLAYVLMS